MIEIPYRTNIAALGVVVKGSLGRSSTRQFSPSEGTFRSRAERIGEELLDLL